MVLHHEWSLTMSGPSPCVVPHHEWSFTCTMSGPSPWVVLFLLTGWTKGCTVPAKWGGSGWSYLPAATGSRWCWGGRVVAMPQTAPEATTGKTLYPLIQATSGLRLHRYALYRSYQLCWYIGHKRRTGLHRLFICRYTWMDDIDQMLFQLVCYVHVCM